MTFCYKFFRGRVWSRGLEYPKGKSRSHLVGVAGGTLISFLENHLRSWAGEETAAEGYEDHRQYLPMERPQKKL